MTKKPSNPVGRHAAKPSKRPRRDDKSVVRQPAGAPAVRRQAAGRQGDKAAAREVKYYGVHACLELIRKRRDATIRAYVTEAQLPQFKKYLQWCAETRRAYHMVSAEELEAITQSVHHEGVCILTTEVAVLEEGDFLKACQQSTRDGSGPILYLAGTANPHNVGAIMRSAAHFGVRYILGERGGLPRIGGALARISKGGCEHVELVACQESGATLRALRELGYRIVSTSSHGDASLYKVSWPAKMVLMLGHETRGVAAKTAQNADLNLVIPGSGEVESLNVSVACAVILSEWYRAQQR